MPSVEFGIRKAILNDLSPMASFLTYNYNSHINLDEFKSKLYRILTECRNEYGWVYETNHTSGMKLSEIDTKGIINYTIWSDVLICPHCGNEIVFWNAAVDGEKGKVKKVFECSY